MVEPNRVTDDVGRKSVTLISIHHRIIDQQQLTCQYPQVPTLVPKPGSPTVTQGNLRCKEPAALRALESSWVMLDREICLLKIRVSVVRLMRHIPVPHPAGALRASKSAPARFVIRIGWGRTSPFGQLRRPDSLCESVRSWPPSSTYFLQRSLPGRIWSYLLRLT